MAITSFIPTIWTENLLSELDKQYIAAAHCNREYEGDIIGKGSTVRICGLGPITIGDYTKNNNMGTPQTLSDTYREITVNRAKYFNFQIDDVDRAQSSPKLMTAAMSAAANALSAEADKYIFGLYSASTNKTTYTDVTPENILDSIISARQKLYENNVGDGHDVFLEISPAVASILLKAKLVQSTDNTETLEKGCLGMVAGCKVFVSNSISKYVNTDEGTTAYRCLMRTKRAIAYVDHLTEIEAYRPESRFCDAIKGLHLYGAGLVYPGELMVLEYVLPTAA